MFFLSLFNYLEEKNNKKCQHTEVFIFFIPRTVFKSQHFQRKSESLI